MKIARSARESVRRNIAAWVAAQPGTQQALCRRLEISASQLSVLVKDGVERCSLEYLLDVWERCGGTYSLTLGRSNGKDEPQGAVRGNLAAGSLDP
jgi:predicted XRE-type DNA-binding protein